MLGDRVHVTLETRQVLLLLGNIDEFLRTGLSVMREYGRDGRRVP